VIHYKERLELLQWVQLEGLACAEGDDFEASKMLFERLFAW
jgi:hypothetical protein